MTQLLSYLATAIEEASCRTLVIHLRAKFKAKLNYNLEPQNGPSALEVKSVNQTFDIFFHLSRLVHDIPSE